MIFIPIIVVLGTLGLLRLIAKRMPVESLANRPSQFNSEFMVPGAPNEVQNKVVAFAQEKNREFISADGVVTLGEASMGGIKRFFAVLRFSPAPEGTKVSMAIHSVVPTPAYNKRWALKKFQTTLQDLLKL